MKNPLLFVSIGLFLVVGRMILTQFVSLPDFLNGLILGIGLALEVIGLYGISRNPSKVKKFKKSFFKKIFS
ncbi:hypothetical protein [Falsibacillus albus]|uniref:Uncharacterized protein n=1 Tax=Falsibacillus albus TaxID=2478915 RepID=A0A3L7JP96_9BACI|nr:hypothetical protein [Falsibacillus albus]RLQ92290.1 hypothetical protein D9X91_19635 [Falsibacillus albus]